MTNILFKLHHNPLNNKTNNPMLENEYEEPLEYFRDIPGMENKKLKINYQYVDLNDFEWKFFGYFKTEDSFINWN